MSIVKSMWYCIIVCAITSEKYEYLTRLWKFVQVDSIKTLKLVWSKILVGIVYMLVDCNGKLTMRATWGEGFPIQSTILQLKVMQKWSYSNKKFSCDIFISVIRSYKFVIFIKVMWPLQVKTCWSEILFCCFYYISLYGICSLLHFLGKYTIIIILFISSPFQGIRRGYMHIHFTSNTYLGNILY